MFPQFFKARKKILMKLQTYLIHTYLKPERKVWFSDYYDSICIYDHVVYN